MKIRKMNIFIISALLIFGSFSNVNALSLNQEQSNETEHLEITPYAFSQKTYKKKYSDTVWKDSFGVYYDIDVVCSLNYNTNTYKVSSAQEPKIVTNTLVFSTDVGSAYPFLDDLSTTCKISADKTYVTYNWEFKIRANMLGKRMTFKTISGSKTIKV